MIHHHHLSKLYKLLFIREYHRLQEKLSTESLQPTNQRNSPLESLFLQSLSTSPQTSILVFSSMLDREIKLLKIAESICYSRILTWRLLLTQMKLSTTVLLKCLVVNLKWISTDNQLSTEQIVCHMMSSMFSPWWLTVLLNQKTLSRQVWVFIKIKKAINLMLTLEEIRVSMIPYIQQHLAKVD